LNQGDGFLKGLLGILHIFLLNGRSDFLDRRLDEGFDVEVPSPSFHILFGPFDGRRMTCQDDISFLYLFPA